MFAKVITILIIREVFRYYNLPKISISNQEPWFISTL